MRLIIPAWVHHSGAPIFSIHLHPTADKLATSGQGEMGGSGLVVIWNLRPILDEKSSSDPKCHQVLAKIPHQSGVNCARWSRDGALLACAADDKTISIWEFAGRVDSAGTVGQKGGGCSEKYRLVHTLHAHSMEVLSLEWSHDGRYLATASMDNSVIVWNARKLPERVVVLSSERGGHSGPVKGLSWDPIGKYLTTQAADKSLRMWTTDTWQCDKVISKPFEESSQTTMFLRMDWTPDGQYLVAPCAMNNGGPTGQIIKRSDWDTSHDLVGHRKSVQVVRICKRLLNYTDHTGKTIQVSCIAVGARDKSLSIWAIPSLRRPLLVMERLFKHSIMDLTWRDLTLVVCSQDGTCKALSFTEKELGKMLSLEEMGEACERLYHQRPPQYASVADSNGESRGGLDTSVLGTPGRAAFVDTPEELVARRLMTNAKSNGEALAAASVAAAAARAEQTARLAEARKTQVEARSKDGKKRIQPVFLSSVTLDADASTVPVSTSSLTGGAEKEKEKGDAVNTTPKTQVISIKTKSIPKRVATESTTESSDSGSSSEADSDMEVDGEKEKGGERTQRTMLALDFNKPQLRAAESTRIQLEPASTLLELPEQKATIDERVPGTTGESVLIENECSHAGVSATRVRLFKQGAEEGGASGGGARGEEAWTAFVHSPVLIAASNKAWLAVACADRSLRVFSMLSGRCRLNLLLDATAARIGLAGQKLYALTSTGHFSSWEVDKQRCLLARQPISDCLSEETSLTAVSMSPSGMPLLSFSNGGVVTFSPQLKSWLVVDCSEQLHRLCDAVGPDELGDGAIGKTLKRRKRPGPLPSVACGVRSSVREGILEGWMDAAVAVSSPNDYSALLNTYTQQLIRSRSERKLRELMEELSVPGSVCGLSNEQLKKDVEKLVYRDPVACGWFKGGDGCSHSGVLF